MHENNTTEIPGGGEHYLVARKRKRRRNALVALVLVAAAAGGWYWYDSRETVEADQPLIVAAAYGDIENTIASAGSLEPSRIVDVGAQVSGQLQKLYVDVGHYVQEGQLLAEIDARVQENRVRASEASIYALRAQIPAREAALELARQNAERQERLWMEDATSKLDYQNAQNSFMSAEASLEQLIAQIRQNEASLETDKTQLEFTRIYAPFSGTVTEVLLNEGVTLNANQSTPTILRVADLSRMTVKTQISEADIGRIEAGMDVYFTTLGGGVRRWYSKLEQIWPSPTVENNVVLYTGLFSIDNSDGALLSGMTTQVYFVTSAAYDVLTVPLGALTFNDLPMPSRDGAMTRMTRTGGSGGADAGAGASVGEGRFPRGDGAAGEFSRASFPAGGRPGGEGGFRGELAAAGGEGGFPGAAGLRGPAGQGMGFAGRLAAGEGAARAPRPATVRVVRDDGSTEEREIVIGVASRVAAEVISGLEAGERVIAGIIQANAPETPSNNNRNQNFRGPQAFRFF